MATSILFFFCMLILYLFSKVQLRIIPSNEFNVIKYGAIGDGNTDDTKVFMDVWNAACKCSLSSPTIRIPENKRFLLNPLLLEGPCKSNNLRIQMDGNIIAPNKPSKWNCIENICNKWIHIKNINGLTINGSGFINGQGEKWWKLNIYKRPNALAISDSNNVRINGLTFENNPHVHIAIDDSTSISISNVKIIAPGNSPNTDGINVRGSKNIFVRDCEIRTGDDCIAITDGSSHININNIKCGPGHGISIGSLGKHGSYDVVEHVYVRDIEFNGAKNGARIKTWQGGKGYARHIKFEKLRNINTEHPIIIDQFYCDHEQCTTHGAAVNISNITYDDIRGTSKKKIAVRLACSDTVACTDIRMNNINLHMYSDGRNSMNNNKKKKIQTSSYCNNAHGVSHGHMVPFVHCLKQI